MGPIAEALSNEDIRNLAPITHRFRRQGRRPPPALTLSLKHGEKLAARHRCRSCHGQDYSASGPPARLSGQREDVLLKALRDFKSGARVGSGVASMADATFELNNADMQALAHYMATRP